MNGRIGFNHQKYISLQSAKIAERIDLFGGKLYLEFGGKLFDDFHASRVLPGFEPDSKIHMLMQMKEKAEVIIAVSAVHIEGKKMRSDIGIPYENEVLRLIDAFREIGLYVGSVVITKFSGQKSALAFRENLERLGMHVYLNYFIEGYPNNASLAVSREGYGRNEYIGTVRPLVVVTAPGPDSGKMAVCMSQLYHDNLRGIRSGYAKFETFPIWNLPIDHPVNVAYEAATADIGDVNRIDTFHEAAHHVTAVNYNRDLDNFNVLKSLFERIYGESPYQSPTDMGVNMAGFCIEDDEVCAQAGRDEILRRYFQILCEIKRGKVKEEAGAKVRAMMDLVGITEDDRPVIRAAKERSAETGSQPAVAIQLPDGRIVTGKTSNLLGAASAALLNAVKQLADKPKELDFIPSRLIEPVQRLKTGMLGNHNPRLHSDETLVALAVSAADSRDAEEALEKLALLRGCEAHSTVIFPQVDEDVYRKLGIRLTCEAMYHTKKLYHK